MMLKTLITTTIIKGGIEPIAHTYNFFASSSKLSTKRKTTIEERRAQLKVEYHYPSKLKIVIEEMLSYKTTLFTLDDRYLELEQILDAIEASKANDDTDNLIEVCESIKNKLQVSPGVKNALLERLIAINVRIQTLQTHTLKAKL